MQNEKSPMLVKASGLFIFFNVSFVLGVQHDRDVPSQIENSTGEVPADSTTFSVENSPKGCLVLLTLNKRVFCY